MAKVYIDHDPNATFMYLVRLPDTAEDVFDDTTTVTASLEVPTAEGGVNYLPALAEWEGTSRTRIRVNAGTLLGAISARMIIKIVHNGDTFTTDTLNIRMVN